MHAFGRMKDLRFGAAAVCGIGLAAALGGCDAQAATDYIGESLFTVRGRVTITEDRTEGNLIPALAFLNRESGQIQVLDVAVKGEFPSNFRIDVFDRPSDDVLQKFTELNLGGIEAAPGSEDDEPLAAIGYITAVTEDHPDTIYYGTDSTGPAVVATCDTCSQECDPVLGCTNTEEWCAGSTGENCYSETTICPRRDSPPEDCHVEREGDPAIKEPVWEHFAGFSQNFMLAYLKTPAPAGTYTAAFLGSPKGLRTGYHLLEVLAENEDLQREYTECNEEAEQQGVERYNTEHDTAYTPEDLDLVSCGLGCFEADENCQFAQPAVCDLPESEREGVVHELKRSIVRSKIDLECLLSPLQPVTNIAKTSISIVISPDAQPQF